MSVDASADTDVSSDARGAFGMDSGMTIMNGLKDLRPWSFWWSIRGV